MIKLGQNKTQPFTGSQFVIAAGIAVVLCALFGFLSLSRAGQLSNTRLAGRINPNDAPVASMIRLPGIGISRAMAISAYRDKVSKKTDGRAVFETIEDLQKVKGIGPKTTKNINPWLKFE